MEGTAVLGGLVARSPLPWRDPARDEPLLLVGGGSGLVPLMAMLHRRATGSTVDARLLLSARTIEDVLYRDELEELAGGSVLPDRNVISLHGTWSLARPSE